MTRLLLFFLACSAHATIIPIANSDFETGPYQLDNVVSGWVVDHAYTWVEFIPSESSHFGLLNAPSNNPAEGQGAFHQVLETNWSAGTYDFSLIVADFYGFQGYDGGLLAELKAGSTVVGSASYTPGPGSGGYDSAFHELSISVSVGAGDAAVGQAIGIYFTHTGSGGAFVDNVSLTQQEAVPEPGSVWMVMGGVALVGVGWRRRRRQ
jgi:hypothetical protein